MEMNLFKKQLNCKYILIILIVINFNYSMIRFSNYLKSLYNSALSKSFYTSKDLNYISKNSIRYLNNDVRVYHDVINIDYIIYNNFYEKPKIFPKIFYERFYEIFRDFVHEESNEYLPKETFDKFLLNYLNKKYFNKFNLEIMKEDLDYIKNDPIWDIEMFIKNNLLNINNNTYRDLLFTNSNDKIYNDYKNDFYNYVNNGHKFDHNYDDAKKSCYFKYLIELTNKENNIEKIKKYKQEIEDHKDELFTYIKKCIIFYANVFYDEDKKNGNMKYYKEKLEKIVFRYVVLNYIEILFNEIIYKKY